ncbi:NAD(P)H-dependent oxidoreductase [Microbaculum marinum]|uniref:NAD(P)H-dependent oxidoreductase n=1 Tax=Microbaculum marinum TaxID=1764581 RepID=A0AAW9RW14_9HYPH
MRAHVLYAHPVETSYCAALHSRVVDQLAAAGHEVDDFDLYAAGFEPLLSRAERLAYHDIPDNRQTVSDCVDRLLAAEALILVFPVWNFGFPAILKGYFDRVFLPGVSFRMEDGVVQPNLDNLRRIVAVTTYGGTRLRAWMMGDPPRRLVKRLLNVTAPNARVSYHALYDMNRADDRRRSAFLDRAGHAMRTI